MTTSTTITHAAVDEMLDAIVSGAGIPARIYTDGATLDATVPGWRFHRRGAGDIAAEYGGWFAHPARFEELERRHVLNGEVVTYTLAWSENGVPHAAHHCHVLGLDETGGRIASDTVFCGGRWDAALLAQMAEADASR